MQGKLDAATEEYRQALSIVERLGHRYGVALLNMNLGAAYARMGEWDRADAYLGRSRERFREIGSEEFLAELCRHRAEVARGQGDLELALERAQRSLEHARANQMELEEGPTWRVLGRIQRERGRLDQAHEALERALSLTTDTDNPYEAARTRVELARLHIQRGQREKGRRLAREAAQTFTELGAQLDLREAKSLIT
jgi:tetratricopeptide (TPR) repeat protein